MLQAALYLEGSLDSTFGTNTQKALKKLQGKKGLFVEGKQVKIQLLNYLHDKVASI
ncbi:peptidoglycan-binding protein [Bacillus sp. mrc49]|uniref:peptidoglycan-binding protein n=1 Tax=Bacillus sp. mrc49 TaxID=2054913 RepID=UPI000C276DF3|nr:hypothetical protein CVN76_29820 [Bacillus sp. mrc49]